MARVLTPLPEIEPAKDLVVFENLAFPIGFDEERILVNVPAIQKIQTYAGIGLTVMNGVNGKKSETSSSIQSVNADGSANLGQSLIKRNASSTDTVFVPSRHELGAFMGTKIPARAEKYLRPPAYISANLSARDELLQDSKRFKKGQLDPKGHAEFMNTVIKQGLVEAAAKRHQNSYDKLVRALVAVVTLDNIAVTIALRESWPVYALGMWYGLAGFLSFKEARQNSKQYDYPTQAYQFSIALGWDRRFMAQSLARTTRLIEVRK